MASFRCSLTLSRSRFSFLYSKSVSVRNFSTSDDGGSNKFTPEHPFKRTVNIIKGDLRNIRNAFRSKGKQIELQPGGVPRHSDILIVGGGIVGSSVAYWLKQRAPDSFTVTVLERDQTYTRSTSVLSVGGIRQQYSLPENIELSLYSSQFLRNYKQHLSCLDKDLPDIRFQHHGYLFLASEEGVDQLKENHKIQLEFGGKAELMTAKRLKERFPWISTEGIALGSYGLENEGWFDPWSLLCAFRNKAISLGTEYVGANLNGFKIESHDSESRDTDTGEPHKTCNYATVKTADGTEHQIEFSILIVAGGPYSGEIGDMLGIGKGPGILKHKIPVEPRKRYVYVYHCPNGPGIDCPLLIDPNGTYFRREGLGGCYIGGRSPTEEEEPDITNLDVDYSYFDSQVWPTLAKRAPCFEGIKMQSAWAGFYDYNTFDQNAIIGSHPYFTNVFFTTGFSGHGIQMAPAVGRAVMELILDDEFKTIDLTRFGVERIIAQEPLFESNIV